MAKPTHITKEALLEKAAKLSRSKLPGSAKFVRAAEMYLTADNPKLAAEMYWKAYEAEEKIAGSSSGSKAKKARGSSDKFFKQYLDTTKQIAGQDEAYKNLIAERQAARTLQNSVYDLKDKFRSLLGQPENLKGLDEVLNVLNDPKYPTWRTGYEKTKYATLRNDLRKKLPLALTGTTQFFTPEEAELLLKIVLENPGHEIPAVYRNTLMAVEPHRAAYAVDELIKGGLLNPRTTLYNHAVRFNEVVKQAAEAIKTASDDKAANKLIAALNDIDSRGKSVKTIITETFATDAEAAAKQAAEKFFADPKKAHFVELSLFTSQEALGMTNKEMLRWAWFGKAKKSIGRVSRATWNWYKSLWRVKGVGAKLKASGVTMLGVGMAYLAGRYILYPTGKWAGNLVYDEVRDLVGKKRAVPVITEEVMWFNTNTIPKTVLQLNQKLAAARKDKKALMTDPILQFRLLKFLKPGVIDANKLLDALRAKPKEKILFKDLKDFCVPLMGGITLENVVYLYGTARRQHGRAKDAKYRESLVRFMNLARKTVTGKLLATEYLKIKRQNRPAILRMLNADQLRALNDNLNQERIRRKGMQLDLRHVNALQGQLNTEFGGKISALKARELRELVPKVKNTPFKNVVENETSVRVNRFLASKPGIKTWIETAGKEPKRIGRVRYALDATKLTPMVMSIIEMGETRGRPYTAADLDTKVRDARWRGQFFKTIGRVRRRRPRRRRTDATIE